MPLLHLKVRRQLTKISSHFLSRESWGLNSSLRAWWQVPSPSGHLTSSDVASADFELAM